MDDLDRREATPAERYRAAARSGRNGMSFLTLYDGWEYFHPASVEGYVAYERHNGVAVACGEPVCEPGAAPAVLAAFAAFCARERLVPAFAGATAALTMREYLKNLQ